MAADKGCSRPTCWIYIRTLAISACPGLRFGGAIVRIVRFVKGQVQQALDRTHCQLCPARTHKRWSIHVEEEGQEQGKRSQFRLSTNYDEG